MEKSKNGSLRKKREEPNMEKDQKAFLLPLLCSFEPSKPGRRSLLCFPWKKERMGVRNLKKKKRVSEASFFLTLTLMSTAAATRGGMEFHFFL